MTNATFLNNEDVAQLTGRKFKSKQIESLRKMGINFFVNACGKPIVAHAAIEGRKEPAAKPKSWSPPE